MHRAYKVVCVLRSDLKHSTRAIFRGIVGEMGRLRCASVNTFTRTSGLRLWMRKTVKGSYHTKHLGPMSRGPWNNITTLREGNHPLPASQYFDANASLRTHFLPTCAPFQPFKIFDLSHQRTLQSRKNSRSRLKSKIYAKAS